MTLRDCRYGWMIWRAWCWALDVCPRCDQVSPWHAPTCVPEKHWDDLGLRGPC